MGIPLAEVTDDIKGIRADLFTLAHKRISRAAINAALIEICHDLERIAEELRGR